MFFPVRMFKQSVFFIILHAWFIIPYINVVKVVFLPWKTTSHDPNEPASFATEVSKQHGVSSILIAWHYSETVWVHLQICQIWPFFSKEIVICSTCYKPRETYYSFPFFLTIFSVHTDASICCGRRHFIFWKLGTNEFFPFCHHHVMVAGNGRVYPVCL